MRMWLGNEKAKRQLDLANTALKETPFERMFHKSMGRVMTAAEHKALETADKALDKQKGAAHDD